MLILYLIEKMYRLKQMKCRVVVFCLFVFCNKGTAQCFLEAEKKTRHVTFQLNKKMQVGH